MLPQQLRPLGEMRRLDELPLDRGHCWQKLAREKLP
jgi:hypothetical protein